jgi:hypothetical protein
VYQQYHAEAQRHAREENDESARMQTDWEWMCMTEDYIKDQQGAALVWFFVEVIGLVGGALKRISLRRRAQRVVDDCTAYER